MIQQPSKFLVKYKEQVKFGLVPPSCLNFSLKTKKCLEILSPDAVGTPQNKLRAAPGWGCLCGFLWLLRLQRSEINPLLKFEDNWHHHSARRFEGHSAKEYLPGSRQAADRVDDRSRLS